MNPAIERLRPYAFTQLGAQEEALRAKGVRLLKLGVGDPEDDTPAFIREALVAAVTPAGRYPTAAGLPELRQAVADWIGRRYGVEIDPGRHVLPANGSKEALYNLAPLLLDDPRRRAEPELIAFPELAYQVYGDSALLHHAEPLALPLDADWLPDLNAISPAVGERLKLLWLNFPNNPTGKVAPLSYYRDALALAERYDFYVGSDEAYSELWYDRPPPGLLQAAAASGFRRAIVVNTLSKRSNMTAYRSGFVAGDPEVIRVMKNVRPRMGVATPEFIQRAAVAAWGDEAHVEAQRRRYAERRALFLDLFRRKGVQVEASEAAFYLWIRVPESVPGRDSGRWAEALVGRGLVLLPGAFFGPRGREYVRLAFVPRLEVCREAVAILEQVL
ncbi:MAG TPA: aminotransferase class I/II-fold pyridoxal phosphate-dependent enzyme [Chloroflexota bacterium]|nr:aminotransferase class I/II-fold pyridoxal phosphate-dependent enzyme [Chloroflexota bacterium]